MQKNIIQNLGLGDLPEKEQEEALMTIGKIIFQSVLIRVMDDLSDEDAGAFEKLLEEKPDDQEAILGFLQAKVSNLDEIVNDEVAKFKQESVDFISKIKSK